MKIVIRKLIPNPVAELPNHASEIWEKEEILFGSGEVIQLTAASGKGKTSLLSIIYGLRHDYRGSVLIDGKDIRELREKERTRLRRTTLSCVFQGLELFDELSAMKNIQLKNRQEKFKTRQEIMLMAERLEIAPFLEKECGKLSFGQKQRVAIIRSLCQPFQYLLADEIFSHLDDETGRKASELISEELGKQGAGMLFTDLRETGLFKFDKSYRI